MKKVGWIIFRHTHPNRPIVAYGDSEDAAWREYHSIYGKRKRGVRAVMAERELVDRLRRVGSTRVKWTIKDGMAILDM